MIKRRSKRWRSFQGRRKRKGTLKIEEEAINEEEVEGGGNGNYYHCVPPCMFITQTIFVGGFM